MDVELQTPEKLTSASCYHNERDTPADRPNSAMRETQQQPGEHVREAIKLDFPDPEPQFELRYDVSDPSCSNQLVPYRPKMPTPTSQPSLAALLEGLRALTQLIAGPDTSHDGTCIKQQQLQVPASPSRASLQELSVLDAEMAALQQVLRQLQAEWERKLVGMQVQCICRVDFAGLHRRFNPPLEVSCLEGMPSQALVASLSASEARCQQLQQRNEALQSDYHTLMQKSAAASASVEVLALCQWVSSMVVMAHDAAHPHHCPPVLTREVILQALQSQLAQAQQASQLASQSALDAREELGRSKQRAENLQEQVWTSARESESVSCHMLKPHFS